MDDSLSLESVLDGGLDALLNPAVARRKAGIRLPELVVQRLFERPEKTSRDMEANRLATETWSSVREKRGGRWDLGWAELTAGLALAVELLAGELPPRLLQEIKGTPAERIWREVRRPHQRFVLLVDSSAHVRRVFSTPQGRDASHLVESSTQWLVDGPPFRDRSHTLMLALMADNALAAERGPVAATGVLLEGGDRVGPVGSFAAKAREWHRHSAEALLISAVPAGHDQESWTSLLKGFTQSQNKAMPQWVVGNTLSEITAKLAIDDVEITGWNGSVLDQSSVLAPGLSASGVEQQARVTGDPLFDACWEAWRDASRGGTRRGVLVNGPPGAGKSVLSLSLEAKFARGVLGALGYGVRRTARDLARDINDAQAPTWAGVLAVREPSRAALFETLAESNRLVLIVDGLDELQPAQLSAVSKWLRGGNGWWLGTSRPVRGVGTDLPPAWELKLDGLGQGDASKFLTALGRRDLAENIWPNGGARLRSSALEELTRTPLQLALLASVITPGEDLTQLDPHHLYEQVFEGLLDNACRSGRLRVEDAGLLRRLGSLVGELALSWLRSPTGHLSQADVDKTLDNLKIGLLDQGRVMDALTFGYLLVPAGAGWDFGHRTLAEWAAAAALYRQVEATVQASRSAGDIRSPRARRAEAEVSAIAEFLENDELPEHGRWSTLLRFYAAHLQEPLAFIHRLLGPAHVAQWKIPAERGREIDSEHDHRELRPATSSEVLGSWAFAFELMRAPRWHRASDAREAWALAVRRWLLSEPKVESFSDQEGLAALRTFTVAIGEHLPRSLAELLALAARTQEQRQRLDADPLIILPAVPAVRASTLSGLLEHGDRRQQLAVLKWHEEQGIAPASTVLEQLARRIPDELERLSRSRAAPDEARGNEDESVLSRLEVAVWRGYLSHAEEPPPGVIKRRFMAWPKHLRNLLIEWFGKLHDADPKAYGAQDSVQPRREVFAGLLRRAADVETQITGLLEANGDSAQRACLIGRVRYFFSDSDDRRFRRLVDSIATARGWPHQDASEPRPIELEDTASTIRQNVVLLDGLRAGIASLVGALPDLTRLEDIVGELWSLLPPADASRREILIALDGEERVPRQISAEEILNHHGSSPWSLERLLWTDDHLKQLRQLGSSGRGPVRYEAIRAVSRVEKRDETASLVANLPSDDEVFTALVYERIGNRHAREDKATPIVPDPSRLSLAGRADARSPGWRAELLAGLASPSMEDVAELIDIAVRHRVIEALPFLANRLGRDERRDIPVITAIGLLVGHADESVARIALQSALRVGWPDGRNAWSRRPRIDEPDSVQAGSVLAQFLRIEDLDILLQGSVSALKHPSLGNAIRGLGPDAIEKLLDLHRDATNRLNATEASSDEKPATALKRRDALAETIIASLDSSASTPERLVDILLLIAGEDVHHVYAMPGPLGSDFDEPGDMDWHADQLNEDLVEAAAEALEKSIASHPLDWPQLERLFRHPSESLRKRAFEMCADRAAPHEVAELALKALEGHTRENRTRWTGRSGELLLAGYQGGQGTVNVKVPDTASALVTAVRKRLTPAHRAVVQSLAAHRHPVFRGLAARWAGELGDERWVDFILPLLNDVDPGVISSTVGALLSLAPGALESWILTSNSQRWVAAHDQALLARLLPRPEPFEFLNGRSKERPPQLIEHISERAFVVVLTRAANRAAEKGEKSASSSTGFSLTSPSLIEQVFDAWARPLGEASVDMVRRWTDSPSRLVRVVGRRVLAARQALDTVLVRRLLQAPEPMERFSGAECATRMGLDDLAPVAVAVVRGMLADAPTAEECAAAGLRPPPADGSFAWGWRRQALGADFEVASLDARLRWALDGHATPRFAALLPLVAGRIPYDDSEGCYELEGEEVIRVVSHLIERWGSEGAPALLDLLDEGQVEDDYAFRQRFEALAVADPGVLVAIQERARRGGGVSEELLTAIQEGEFERNLDGLARLLEFEVFPVNSHSDSRHPGI